MTGSYSKYFKFIKLQKQRCFVKKVLLMPATLLKETLAKVFSCEFCEIFKNTFFTEHHWTTAFCYSEVHLRTTVSATCLLVNTVKPFLLYSVWLPGYIFFWSAINDISKVSNPTLFSNWDTAACNDVFSFSLKRQLNK